MKSVLGVCLLAVAMATAAVPQEPSKPVLRHGIQVEMATADHAVEMPAADNEDATVLSITRTGKLFLGVQPVGIADLSSIHKPIVYLKADARVPYQNVLTVLDALHGKAVVLLTASRKQAKTPIVPPYGVKLTVGGE